MTTATVNQSPTVTAKQLRDQEQEQRDALELKEQQLKDQQVNVYTFSYALGNEPTGGFRANVLAKSEGEAKLLLAKHIEARHHFTKDDPAFPHDPAYPLTPGVNDSNDPATYPTGPNVVQGHGSALPGNTNQNFASRDSRDRYEAIPYNQRGTRNPLQPYDRHHYTISSGTVAVQDVITVDTPLPVSPATSASAVNATNQRPINAPPLVKPVAVIPPAKPLPTAQQP